jgi:hypothetical protein
MAVQQEAEMAGRGQWSFEVPPSAARLTASLRDIGYDFQTAVADLVDNSIAAGATRVDVDLEFDGANSWVSIADDGVGMTANGVVEALRYGTRRGYGAGELGRYGLGLKTAPLSQCRSVTVVTRRSTVNKVITRRTLDLDVIEDWDAWMVVEAPATPAVARGVDRLQQAPGTVVVWEKLDRVLPNRRPEGGWARRRMTQYAARVADHLAMVFHRFLEGEARSERLTITVNGEKVRPWNPFAPQEPATLALSPQAFEILAGEHVGEVRLKGYVLPSRDRFSSLGEFERMSGPMKWNRQQGIYVYRADRLVQWGGWSGIRAIDEHTKLARVALDFDTDLDDAFHINVAKMRVTIPSTLRQMLERPLHEVCTRADDAYRTTAKSESSRSRANERTRGRDMASPSVGLALRSAAMELGHLKALNEITKLLRDRDPDVVRSLGLD